MTEGHTAQPPHKNVVPMKVNAFEQMRLANSQLAPLFPYMHAGAIIPCSASFENEPDSRMGYFIHQNSVDEVALVLGSDSQSRTGDVWRGPFKHGVGFDAPVPFFMAMVITQRQREDGEQPETWVLPCEQCNEPLAVHEFSGAATDDPFPPLPTTKGSLEAAQITENDEDKLKCASCGHQNPRFPTEVWGWDRYMMNTRVVQKGYAAMKEAVQ